MASGLSIRSGDGVDDLAQVVGRDVGGHPDRDALTAVDQQVREARRQDLGYLELTRVVVDEIDRVLADAFDHLQGDRRQTTLRVAGGSRRIVERTEVALRLDEGVTEAELLAHAHQRVVDRVVAVRVVLAHHLAGDTRAFQRGAIGHGAQVVHAPEDAPVHGLEPVADVGQRTRRDDRHGVIEEGALHLLLDLDGLDRAEVGGFAVAAFRWLYVRHAEAPVPIRFVPTSDVEEPDVFGVRLDEVLALLGVVAHELREDLVGHSRRFDRHL